MSLLPLAKLTHRESPGGRTEIWCSFTCCGVPQVHKLAEVEDLESGNPGIRFFSTHPENWQTVGLVEKACEYVREALL